MSLQGLLDVKGVPLGVVISQITTLGYMQRPKKRIGVLNIATSSQFWLAVARFDDPCK